MSKPINLSKLSEKEKLEYNARVNTMFQIQLKYPLTYKGNLLYNQLNKEARGIYEKGKN